MLLRFVVLDWNSIVILLDELVFKLRETRYVKGPLFIEEAPLLRGDFRQRFAPFHVKSSQSHFDC